MRKNSAVWKIKSFCFFSQSERSDKLDPSSFHMLVFARFLRAHLSLHDKRSYMLSNYWASNKTGWVKYKKVINLVGV